jgi:Ni/Fe-hydrogenase 1 B-type cytochrome subunit
MRLVHFIAAYVFAIGFAVRIYWSIVGNKYSRELIYLPVWRGKWWGELIEEVKFYLFLRREAPLTVAHNALAQVAMWLFNMVLGIFMIGTGFALYSENLGLGSWADRWFGWIVPVLGGSQNTKMLHDFGMWLFVVFAILHIYMAIRADFMGRQSSVRTIIDGWRRYKD